MADNTFVKTSLSRRSWVLGGLAFGTSLGWGLPLATAQARALKLIIPYTPGGSTDIAGRIFAQAVGQEMGVTIVPENKGGAAGLIGMQEVVRSKADGTVFGVSGIGTTALVAVTQKNPPYDFQRDLEAVGHLGAFGSLVLTRASSPFQTLQEMVAHAKKNPESLSFGTPPNGSPSYLTLKYLQDAAGIRILDVPYKGHTEILNGVLSGEIDLGIVSVPQAQELVKNKKLKALAVTSAKRSNSVPEVPTVAESGYPGFEATLWNLIVCRKGTDRELLQRMNAAINKAMAHPDVQKQLHLQSIEFEPFTLQQTQAFVAAETQKWERIAKLVNLKPV
ncbi:MAG: tripartite tricarboxylate transporter substrate binding protein [Comamonas sp.]|nr:tripartite tricarboxylate transporter substrate binding protein [Comamonas sp.]